MNTHGSVTIEDGNKAAEEYAPNRKVSVTFSFEASDGEDGQKFLDDAADKANAKVNELLGRTAAPAKTTRKKAEPKAEASKTEQVLDQKTGAIKTDKDKLAEAAGLPTTDTVAKGTPPSLIEDEDEEIADEEDGLNDLLGDAAPAPITDAELAKAAQIKNALMKQKHPEKWNPAKLRELIVEYAGQPPKKITDIPVGKRQEFLDKVKALEV